MALAAPERAGAMELTGYSGALAEWEWMADVKEKVAGRSREFAGALTLRHTGVCSQDGPEEKKGEIRFQLASFPARMNATIVMDGVECSFSGRLADRYTGPMTCPDRPAQTLNIWLR